MTTPSYAQDHYLYTQLATVNGGCHFLSIQQKRMCFLWIAAQLYLHWICDLVKALYTSFIQVVHNHWSCSFPRKQSFEICPCRSKTILPFRHKCLYSQCRENEFNFIYIFIKVSFFVTDLKFISKIATKKHLLNATCKPP